MLVRGLLRIGAGFQKQAVSSKLNGTASAGPRVGPYQTSSEAFPAADAALAAFARVGSFFLTSEATFMAAIIKISCNVKPRVVMYHICASQQTSYWHSATAMPNRESR